MSAYYNEFDTKAAAWLRELIKQGLIADGEVDERSITEVQAADLQGFTQCHFFAGIGGWSYALRLAGWSDDRPVWTGSPPCQPFSTAGKREGAADARNLWPVFVRLIAERKSPTLFGEQVAAAISNGWLDAVFADLESEGYACGASVLPACSVGAPHIRQRLWFVAESNNAKWRADVAERHDVNGDQAGRQQGDDHASEHRDASELANAQCRTAERHRHEMAGKTSSPEGREKERQRFWNDARNGEPACFVWADLEWLECADGKARPTQPGLFPLVNGVSGRVGLLRGAGNAIVPQVAAEVIGAYMEIAA